MCDATRLIQVFTNLISIGLQYTLAGGSVELRLETVEVPSTVENPFNVERVAIRCSVYNTGRGMSAAEVPSFIDYNQVQNKFNFRIIFVYMCKYTQR
jgi:signal transduction histidine kinase